MYKLENLSKFEIKILYSNPAGIKFTIFRYGNIVNITAITYNIEELKYGIKYKCNLPYNCHDAVAAVTGNNASSGQFFLTNNVLMINSSDSNKLLKNTFMGQLTTFLK